MYDAKKVVGIQTTLETLLKIQKKALAAWHGGHRIRLRNIIPWFESRQGVRFSGKS
jgi:hypothetical protein